MAAQAFPAQSQEPAGLEPVTMTVWTSYELATIGSAGELRLAFRRGQARAALSALQRMGVGWADVPDLPPCVSRPLAAWRQCRHQFRPDPDPAPDRFRPAWAAPG